MRYIVVFTLFAIPVAKGFASIREAANYLERTYDDPDLSPIGLYDALGAVVISDQQDNCILTDMDECKVSRLAQLYIERIA